MTRRIRHGLTPSGASDDLGRPRPRLTGLTLVELVIAMGVIAIGLLALVTAIYQSNLLQQATRERTLAYNAARALIEQMRGEPLHEVYARHNANPADDPAGHGTSPGATFDVQGLAPPGGEPRVGRVLFPESGDPPSLRENIDDRAFGMPGGRDLNRDGVIDAAAHGSDYRILPVRVLATWEGIRGRQHIDVYALLTER